MKSKCMECNFDLVCLCASHIDNVQKIQKIQNMLKSWKEQNILINMIVSISYDSSVKQDFEILLNNLKKYDNLIVNNELNIKKKQFEHYKIICEKYCEYLNNKWIIFTDDDDIWLNNRTETFLKLISEHNSVEFILYPFIYISNRYFENSDKVVENLNTLFKTRIDTVSEYVCFCTKFHNVKNFTTTPNKVIVDKNNNIMTTFEILNTDFADRYFIAYLKIISNGNYTKIRNLSSVGIYYYCNTNYSLPNTPCDKNFFTYIS